MSDAKSTIRFAIMNSFTVNPDRTGLRPEGSEILLDDVMESLFSDVIRWDIEDYLKELND